MSETGLGLGSGGEFSRPDEPVCAGCELAIVGEAPVWEMGAQWHRACVPPGLNLPVVDRVEDFGGPR